MLKAEQALYVEKMRIAILNGISVESAFALPSMMIPPVPRPLFPGFPSQHCLNFHPAGGESVIPSYGDRGRGRDVCGRFSLSASGLYALEDSCLSFLIATLTDITTCFLTDY